MATKSKALKAELAREQAEAIESLKAQLQDGRLVYTVCTHVARSGMSRCIRLVVADGCEVVDVSWAAAKALGWKLSHSHGGVVVEGYGMDMGFHVVYCLRRTLGLPVDVQPFTRWL